MTRASNNSEGPVRRDRSRAAASPYATRTTCGERTAAAGSVQQVLSAVAPQSVHTPPTALSPRSTRGASRSSTASSSSSSSSSKNTTAAANRKFLDDSKIGDPLAKQVFEQTSVWAEPEDFEKMITE